MSLLLIIDLGVDQDMEEDDQELEEAILWQRLEQQRLEKE